MDEDGKPRGIFIELIDAIAKEEDLDLLYVEGDWMDLKEMLIERKIDLLPDFAYSEERDSLFTLNKIPILSSWLEAYSLKDKNIHSIRDLNGKILGVLEGSVQEAHLKEDLKCNFPVDYYIRTYSSYPASVEALKRGEIDLLIASRFFYFSPHFEDGITSTGIILRPSELHLAFAKEVDSQLVNLFDQQLAKMKNDPQSDYYRILQTYLDPVLGSKRPKRFLWLLAVLLIMLLVVLVFTFLLKHQVDLKTKALWRRNRQLTRAKEKAEENERLKNIFLQNMSHEIRTPMNGIIGFLSLLKQTDLDAQSREKYLDIVNKSGKRLLTTINNIIEISKIDSRQVDVRLAAIDLIDVMNFYHNFFLPQAKEKNLEFRLNCQIPSDKAIILTDKFILDNILTNLINNALKFTSKGYIEMGAYHKGEEIEFYIRDTGVGIPKDRQKAIFERFVQANLDMTRAHEGSGLGLAIVKAYVNTLNGRIWLESQEKKGTTFYFAIPYVPATLQLEELENLPEQLKNEDLFILIAEDDNISYLFLKQILNLPGITLIRATNGRQAVEKAKENPNLSLILMDIKMPELSGIAATKLIREFNPSVPIIAQSAYTFSGEQEEAIAAGCNDYITKPIDKNTLLNLIRKYSSGE